MNHFQNIDARNLKLGILCCIRKYSRLIEQEGNQVTKISCGFGKELRPIVFGEKAERGRDILLGNRYDIPDYPIYSREMADGKGHIGIYEANDIYPFLSRFKFECNNLEQLESVICNYIMNEKWKQLCILEEKDVKKYLFGLITVENCIREEYLLPKELIELFKKTEKMEWFQPAPRELQLSKKYNPYHSK